MQPINASQLASARAHDIMAEMIKSHIKGTSPPAVGVAEDGEHELLVVVHIAEKKKGMMKDVQDVLAKDVLKDVQDAPGIDMDEEIGVTAPMPPLTPMQMRVLSVLRFDKGMVGGVIAVKIKADYGGGFRSQLSDLCKRKFAHNNDDREGYWLTKAGRAAYMAQLRQTRERPGRSN